MQPNTPSPDNAPSPDVDVVAYEPILSFNRASPRCTDVFIHLREENGCVNLIFRVEGGVSKQSVSGKAEIRVEAGYQKALCQIIFSSFNDMQLAMNYLAPYRLHYRHSKIEFRPYGRNIAQYKEDKILDRSPLSYNALCHCLKGKLMKLSSPPNPPSFSCLLS